MLLNKYSLAKIVIFCIVLFLVISCATVPLTGRKQIGIIPGQTMLSTSFQQYDSFLAENSKSKNRQQEAMVKRIGNNIRLAVESYLKSNNLGSRLAGYDWEFNLIQSDEVNAWCMPGGKVVVYTGLLPITKNEDGLAVVMGHEIAHAIADHGNERMSQSLLTSLGGQTLSQALKDKPEKTQQLWMSTFGIGSQLGVLLPFSRLHEREADRLGMIFMAMAGYDPQAAVGVWERMAANGAEIPEFLSTHPSGKSRIAEVKSYVPEARTYLKK
jgi:predicted Zn-dependent protease